MFSVFYIAIIAVFSLLFILLSGTIVSFLTAGKFTYASTYANVFIIGVFFMQIGGFFEQLFTAFGATKYVMWRNILMGVFCIVLYYLMIQKYQFYGANISRIIASVFYVISGAILFLIYIKRKKI